MTHETAPVTMVKGMVAVSGRRVALQKLRELIAAGKMQEAQEMLQEDRSRQRSIAARRVDAVLSGSR